MTNALTINDLHKTYRGGFTALHGVDLEVRQGDFLALLGPNGAGKSTIIGIIASLINKTSGKVRIFDYDIDHQHNLAKRHIGLVPQEFNFNMWEPVIEIVVNQAGYYGIDRHTANSRAEHYLRKLGLWEKRREMARNLSGGMKRRLMIVRALIHEPQLLILDEPTAGVDIELRRSMWNFLREINAQGTTIILTTHYLEEAESLCKQVAIINEGRIIENTDVKTLINQLHVEHFILDLKQPVTPLPQLHQFELRTIDETTLEVAVAKEQDLNDLFSQLSDAGIEVISMRNRSNRLEELFLRLVGNSTQETTPP